MSVAVGEIYDNHQAWETEHPLDRELALAAAAMVEQAGQEPKRSFPCWGFLRYEDELGTVRCDRCGWPTVIPAEKLAARVVIARLVGGPRDAELLAVRDDVALLQLPGDVEHHELGAGIAYQRVAYQRRVPLTVMDDGSVVYDYHGVQ